MSVLLFGILLLSVSSALGRAKSRCYLPKDPGPCRVSFPGYYFNTDNDRCESFSYGGCKGNDNLFDSLKECQETCHDDEDLNISVKNDYCRSPPLTTNEESCLESLQMFTFNYGSLSCEPYVYGGCNGSPNLFKSFAECMGACVHGEIGQGIKVLVPGNDDKEDDICELPPVEPSPMACLASFPNWTFNSTLGECVSYIYGGCGATKNNFESKEDCEEACPKKTASTRFIRPKLCDLPTYINEGPAVCLLLNQGFTFDKDTQACSFIEFGGCGSTDNFFSSMEACQKTCEGKETQS